MPFAKNLNLKDVNPEWAERHFGFKKLAEVPIRFVPVASPYDAIPDNSNSCSLSLNLSSTLEVKITKSANKSVEEVTEKEYKKEGQVKHVVKKLCSRSAGVYLKWKIQVDHVLKNRPCEPLRPNSIWQRLCYMEIFLSPGSYGARPNPRRRWKAHSRSKTQKKHTRRSSRKGIQTKCLSIVWARFVRYSSRSMMQEKKSIHAFQPT